ncbi:hypothetical protein CC78DRAFT_620772 [Lojkania enalia]|uniref:Uncharacterized protein n=1 Tax=Lojkania enalia TaxID=147567 RepID=A0A9P4N2J1_9PLEO|nr:hypothetical protein CC78DRAFT_620772 [Didymosphaeria enalia]
MLVYHAAGVRIRLSASKLQDTVTHETRFNNAEASENSDAAEERLRETAFLSEKNVAFPSDAEVMSVNFLKNVPFLQVKASADLFKMEAGVDHAGRRHSGRVAQLKAKEERPRNEYVEMVVDMVKQPPRTRLQPHGASLIVEPPNWIHVPPSPSLDFELRPPFRHNPELVPKALTLHNLMIDVIFNGILVSSVLVHRRGIVSRNKSFHQVFSGTRIDVLAERPWVIIPLGQNADGSLRGLTRAIGVKEQWDQICVALLDEVDNRGVNTYGERPPSIDYLEDLANMGMPPAAEGLQEPGGRKFGVVDVVIIHGTGRMSNEGLSYLKGPQRLPDGRYKKKRSDSQQMMEGKMKNSGSLSGHYGLSPDRNAGGDTNSNDELRQQQDQQGCTKELYPAVGPSTQPTLIPDQKLLPSSQSSLPLVSSSISIPTVRNRPSVLASFSIPLGLAPIQIPYLLARLKRVQDSSIVSQQPTMTWFLSLSLTSLGPSQQSKGNLGRNSLPHSVSNTDEPSSVNLFDGPKLSSQELNPSLRRVSIGQVNLSSYGPEAPPKDTPPAIGNSRHGTFTFSGSPTDISPLATPLHNNAFYHVVRGESCLREGDEELNWLIEDG